MFIEVTPETKEFILSQGEVEFNPAIKWKSVSTDISYLRYDMFFVYTDGGKDELGKFYLTLRKGLCYEMTAVELTAKCGKALQMFMLELMVKAAIKEAKLAGAIRLEIECNHPLVAYAFLTCNLKIEKFDQVSTNRPLWKGSKKIEQHPLSSMARGLGSL